ncbi:MAG: DUF3365 domain-containing protein [Pseudomonadota bacterium]
MYIARVFRKLCPWGALIALMAITSLVQAAQHESSPSTDAERAENSRTLVKGFAKQLKGELVGAIQKGGPESAIGVCQIVAPAIAEEKSDQKGWSVGRTALKLRNPNNAPDTYEREVLLRFQEKLEQGADGATLEHYETATQDGKAVFRYMKAIPMQGPCLTCHGPNVSPPVA